MTIAEVSRKYDISADTLRYYERIGLIPPVPRTRGGLRDYGEESCGWIQLMKCMRAAGVQIEALIEYVDLFQQGDATLDARKALLVEQRDQLVSRMAEMQASLDLLNQKIDRYEQGMMTAEQQLRRLHAEREGEAQKGQYTVEVRQYIVLLSFIGAFQRPSAPGQPQRPGRRRAGGQHGQEMPHAVLHQRTFQAQHLRAAPDQHDAPGVQDIDQ